MSNPFYDHPILNSPYARPSRYWELDVNGQPTQKIIEARRRAEFITPIPKPKKINRLLARIASGDYEPETPRRFTLGKSKGFSRTMTLPAEQVSTNSLIMQTLLR